MDSENIIPMPTRYNLVDPKPELQAAIEQANNISSYALSIERQLWRVISANSSAIDAKLSLHIINGNVEYIKNTLLANLEKHVMQALAKMDK